MRPSNDDTVLCRACVALPLALLLAAAPGAAQPAARYGEPADAGPPGELARRVTARVSEVARRERREPPMGDARLHAAARDIARAAPPDGRPDNDLVQAALWLHGLVEPPPHLVCISLGRGAEEAALEELAAQLPQVLRAGRYRRVGAAVEGQGDRRLLVVALQESGIELEPIARASALGAAVRVRGRLLPPLARPEVLLTRPDGQVARLPVRGDARGFDSGFACGPAAGRYQLEVVGQDRFGPTVLANFPVYCGRPAPRELPARPRPPEERVQDAASAEAAILHLVNEDRARASLPPLVADPRLAEVARAHAEDMRAHGFVGHVSPTTGSAADRVKGARIDAQVVLENVARAYSPREAERGLMESPGHRANILSREATRLGVGVVLADGVGGVRELLVTQLFTKPVDPVGPEAVRALRTQIDGLRRAGGALALARDPVLDEIAQATADEIARGRLDADRAGAPLEHALGRIAGRYRAVRSVVASAGGVEGLLRPAEGPASEKAVTAAGIGLAAGKRPDGTPALFAVFVLATRR